MKRLVIIYLLSVLSYGLYAQYAESSYSVISHRQYGAQDAYSQTIHSHYGGVYQTSSRSAHYGAEQSDGNSTSYHNAVNYQDRVSANTFSSTPSMEQINTMLPPTDNAKNDNIGPRKSSGVRPPQRAVGDDDKKPEGWEDPLPLGDIPWLLMLLLAGGYAIYARKNQKTTDSRLATRDSK